MSGRTAPVTRRIGRGLSPAPSRSVPRLEDAVLRFFTAWLGIWPSAGTLRVAPSVRRLTQGSDGSVRPLLGVTSDVRFDFATALSVPPLTFPRVRNLVDDLSDSGFRDLAALRDKLPSAVGHPDLVCVEADLRWTTRPPEIRDAGTWCHPSQPALPRTKPPSDGPVLVARHRSGRRRASVQLHGHTNFAYQLVLDADGTSSLDVSAALLSQAAHSVVANGALPFVTADPQDRAMAAVHAAAGFGDRGFQLIELGTDDRPKTSCESRARRLSSLVR